MNRKFKYSDVTNVSLSKNPAHQFAQRFALDVYPSESIYTFIPKNACSTLRFSIAIENGCLTPYGDVHWIHNNNATFKATLSSLMRARFTFLILRCPFSRVLSAFLDKFLERTPDSWAYYKHTNRVIELNELTFHDFILSLKKPTNLNSNIHWRPQSDFLVYDNYDEYFALEEFDRCEKVLKNKIGLKVYDTRNLLNHHSSNKTTKHNTRAWELSVLELMTLKSQGALPAYKLFYSEKIKNVVKRIYKRDFDLYIEKFGEDPLLF
jgi:hypothetical protein